MYDTLNLLETLNKAQELNLAVVVDIPLPSYNSSPEFYEDKVLFFQLHKEVEEIVTKYKDHPALLYWNLGNEIKFPNFYKRTSFFDSYNSLLNLMHELDPNHPISTTFNYPNKLKILGIITRSPKLDFISFNVFGTLSSFQSKIKPIKLLWNGPYLISEWGINGPWETSFTAWNAPIEETSTKKAEQIKDRYKTYLQRQEDPRSLGNLVFYWGHKIEVTPTWFSFFGENREKTQITFELENIWKKSNEEYTGPELEYLLLNEKGAMDNVILFPETQAEVEVILPQNNDQELEFYWEIRKESWYVEDESILIDDFRHQKRENKAVFRTPADEGAYRLYVYLRNNTEYFATANFPFYVLNQKNGE